MSRIQRIPTKQGHPLPKTSARVGMFPPPELLTSTPVVENYESETGNGGPEIPDGGTAQNNFSPTRWFKCGNCEQVVAEKDLDSHDC